MKKYAIHITLLFALLASAAPFGPPLTAQPRLELRYFKANTPQYYYYQLYFSAFCGDSVIYDLEKEQLILEERIGLIATTDYQIDRFASPTRNSCYDLAMAFDNSNGITAGDLTLLAEAGALFVDTMSLSCQRAAILSYADRPTVRTFLSDDREAMKQEMNAMAPGGDRALYDAISLGIIELITNGQQTLRIILVVTTGSDNASSASKERLIDEALYHGVRIFVVGIGDSFDSTPLREIARESGGKYYTVMTPDELGALFTTLPGFFQREFDEHRIVRRTKNVDMKNTLIRLRLEACDDSVWVERTFLAQTVVGVDATPTAQLFTLGQSWPNPVSARAAALHFRFSLEARAERQLALRLYDELGREVATVTERRFAPGMHTVRWQPRGLTPGVYFYRLTGGKHMQTGKMTVLP
ncbi:MAG: VWA domain-containing protein [Bacteroidota bacterium]|nr:VWA domain-containing protein [Bacteroidota bacterium]